MTTTTSAQSDLGGDRCLNLEESTGDCRFPDSLRFLSKLLSLMDIPVQLRIREAEGADGQGPVTHVEIVTSHASLVIGRYGCNLEALQLLVSRVACKESVRKGQSSDAPGRGAIILDCNEYRERRRKELQLMAHSLAQRALESGREVSVDTLSPGDRREIHLALQAVGGVDTRSCGVGAERKLIVFPCSTRKGAASEESGRL